ncbi:tRNA pseudouridine38/39 synthase [Nematocida sp. AWRm78]|nr:tRNA pseudouridine38/39 synthase [Nematocida sp. AWRm79]KAI5183199.1 tRNA pseudouridine38/39 synthase [Nematocida sp. AWRm78]
MSLISRNVLLKLSYNGQQYHGFAYQPGLPTVEHHLFLSLVKNKFVEINNGPPIQPSTFVWPKEILASIALMKYYKCGRTDAGVSAAAQFISIHLPSNTEKDYPYDIMINQHLPNDIRVLGWMFVSDEFSARFTCISREYEYYFSKRPASILNIETMKDASKKLLGTHWFGRLCKQEKESSKQKRLEKKQKLSPDEVTAEESVRTVDSIGFEKVYTDEITGVEVYLMRIRARSFLHNQVRKIFSLLFMVGSGSAIEIENILNKNEVQKHDIKLAEPAPLVLSRCVFSNTDLSHLRSSQSKNHPHIKICEDVLVRSKVNERITKEFFL